jgi:hypothetical protein
MSAVWGAMGTLPRNGSGALFVVIVLFFFFFVTRVGVAPLRRVPLLHMLDGGLERPLKAPGVGVASP